MFTLDTKIPAPVIGAFVAAAMWGVSPLGPQFSVAPVLAYGATALFALAGLSFDVLGLSVFRKMRSTVNPLKPQRSTALVTCGVYRVTRNPMYVGMALLLLAWAMYLSALLPFVGPAIFVAYITRFQIRPEERILKGLFGAEYLAYTAGVRRWR
mgnify:CR=1 FL=1